MSILFKQVKQLVLEIDEFVSTVEQGVLIFKQGVYNYLDKDMEQFHDKIKNIERMEAIADKLQRNIDKELYLHSILPQHASEIEEMIDKLDEIIDGSKESLYEFDADPGTEYYIYVYGYSTTGNFDLEVSCVPYPDCAVTLPAAVGPRTRGPERSLPAANVSHAELRRAARLCNANSAPIRRRAFRVGLPQATTEQASRPPKGGHYEQPSARSDPLQRVFQGTEKGPPKGGHYERVRSDPL